MKIIKKSTLVLFFLVINVMSFCNAELYIDVENNFVNELHISSDGTTIYLESSFLKDVVEQLLTKIKRHDLNFSEKCMIFCEKIVTGCTEFTKVEIEEAIPELFYIIVKKIEDSKAFRPDAPGNSDGAPAGGLFTCDTNKILQALNKLFILIKQCCTIIQIDFSGTFTVLNTLVQDLQGTYTVLNAIENSLLIDFNGVFTTLNACCETEAMDFSGVFTVLTALNDTITLEFNGTFTALNECSQALAVEFNGIFTTLNEVTSTITTEFNNTFTALECLHSVSLEFSGIFTALADFEDTILTEFNGIFTSINTCCQTLTMDLSGVFTVLADITATLTTDFQGSFTIIESINSQFESTFTILAGIDTELINGFNGTFTILNACCEATAVEFNGIFTALNELDTTLTQNFNGTFTTLATCCEALSNDFIGAFTAINDIDETLITDFNGVFTSLNQLTVILESTFTVYNTINQIITTDFNGIFTALETCCNEISADFNGIFTVINSVDEIVAAGFNGTFTALNECFTTIDADFKGIFTTLNTIDQIIDVGFEGTFTALGTITSFPCNPTPITTATTISSPGYYCLVNDIVGTLTIATNNITFDLNRHTITAPGQVGISINGGHNIIVVNGSLEATGIGIQLINTTNTVLLADIFIANCSNSGIVLNAGCVATVMHDIAINSVADVGINFVNNNDNSQCRRVTLFDCAGPIVLGTSGSISNCEFEDCVITGCVSDVATCTLFNIGDGGFNQVTRCSVINCQNNGGDFTAINLGSESTILELCTIQGILSAGTAYGYAINGISPAVQNCSVLNLESSNGSYGFLINGSIATLNTCLVQTATSIVNGSVGAGFLVTQSGVNLINCEAYQVIGTGFHVEPTGADSSLLNCEANNNTLDGFEVDIATIFVGNCTSANNGGFGFDVTVTGTIAMYGCFATHNTLGDYNANCPNVEPVNRQVGVFARGNYFI